MLDLAEVRFMASTGINLILTAMNNANGINGRLHLTGVTANRFVCHPVPQSYPAALHDRGLAPDVLEVAVAGA